MVDAVSRIQRFGFN